MSDFDEEAERERLREQFEHEQQKREATERMSDLLLKGATMTDNHCGECGDPIFRYDGQEFCPTCQREVDTGGDAGAATAEEAAAQSDETAAGTDPEQSAAADATDRREPAEQARETTTGQRPRSERGQAASDPTQPAETGRVPSVETERTKTAETEPAQHTEGASVTAAREALVRTLQAQARQAEACSDPQRAREHLAAAREAAETLSALSRT
jgi:uncharacterized Zn finger protein (UPF0148 family)